MLEFQIDDVTYQAGKLNAFQQLHVSRKLSPVLPKLLPAFLSLTKEELDSKDLATIAEAVAPATEVLASMADADVEYVIGTCMTVVKRALPGNAGWTKAWNEAANLPMYEDIDLGVMLQITWKVLGDSLGNFFSVLLTDAKSSQPVAE
jgi:hypothetical protein